MHATGVKQGRQVLPPKQRQEGGYAEGQKTEEIKALPCTRAHTHTHTHTRTHTHRHTHTHTHTHTHVHTHTYTHKRTHAHTRTHTHTRKHTFTHTYTRTYTRTHTYTHTHTHKHKHTYTNTHISVYTYIHSSLHTTGFELGTVPYIVPYSTVYIVPNLKGIVYTYRTVPYHIYRTIPYYRMCTALYCIHLHTFAYSHTLEPCIKKQQRCLNDLWRIAQ